MTNWSSPFSTLREGPARESPIPQTPPDPHLSLWQAALVLVGVSLLTATMMSPLAAAAYRAEAQALSSAVRQGLWLVGVAAPLLATAKASILAGTAWAVLVLGGAQPRYRRLLEILLTGEVILGLQGLWMAAFLHMRGLGSISRPADLDIVTGLDLFFPDPTTPLGALAETVTPFHVAWVAFLVWAFRRSWHPSSRPRRALAMALVAALGCWLPGPLLAVARTLWG